MQRTQLDITLYVARIEFGSSQIDRSIQKLQVLAVKTAAVCTPVPARMQFEHRED
jgi:fumarate hydratase class II